MEDFLSKDPFAGQAAKLAEQSRAVLKHNPPAQQQRRSWEEEAENCVLARIDAIRILGGLPLHQPPLGPKDRINRLQDLLGYWANGCPFVVDERLFADVLKRRRLCDNTR